MNRRRFLMAASAGVGTLALAANRLFSSQTPLTTLIDQSRTRAVGKDSNPELAATFKVKDGTF